MKKFRWRILKSTTFWEETECWKTSETLVINGQFWNSTILYPHSDLLPHLKTHFIECSFSTPFLGPSGWQHRVVCHRYHFVNPVTGLTTNDIERVWRCMKQYFKCFQPIQPQFFSDFLHDFSFRYNLRIKGNNDRDITDAISLRSSVRSLLVWHVWVYTINMFDSNFLQNFE